ncbi:flagellar operon protein [Bacillus sp. TS-2]|nr:flagellar operon protein [Bacillus sp. TS-2]
MSRLNQVNNCPKCGALFVKALRSLCNACYKEQEDCYDRVSRFMRKKHNRMATIQEVHEKTEVSLELIQQFVREGRILVSQFPNLAYPCESCGQLIQQGRICGSCKSQITGGLEKIDREKEFKNQLKKNESEQNRTYRSINFDRD